jgi:hypothetical protein
MCDALIEAEIVHPEEQSLRWKEKGTKQQGQSE